MTPYPQYTCYDYPACPSGHNCTLSVFTKSIASCTPCSDECSTGAVRCINSSYRETCGNYDSDNCYEWGAQTYCDYGCVSGQCSSTPPCTDECSMNGQKVCDGSYIKTCGNFDSDSCLEWNSIYCADGCENGSCRTCTSHYEAKCSGEDIHWFDSCNRPEEMKEDCRISCMWNSTDGYYCHNGLQVNWNVYAFDLWRNPKQNATVQYDVRDGQGWQFAGLTNSLGNLQFAKLIDTSSGKAVDTRVISAEGADCGEENNFFEKEGDTDTYFFSCPWALTLNGLKVSVSTDNAAYSQGENVSLSIQVSDLRGSPVQEAFVGIILPDGSKATAPNTNSGGNSTYNFTATGIGFQKVTAISWKGGYWNGNAEKRFTVVNANKKLVVNVLTEKRFPVKSAKIFVDGVQKGQTNENGKATVEISTGNHEVLVKASSGSACGQRTIEVNGNKTEPFICPAAIANDFDADGWTDEEEIIFGSNHTDKNDNFCTKLQESYDKDAMSRTTIELVRQLIPDILLMSTEEDGNTSAQLTIGGAIGAPVLGTVIGILAGMIGGAEDDIGAITSLPSIAGGLLTVATDQQTYIALAEKHYQHVMQPILTECQNAKTKAELVNATAGNISEGYWNEFIPDVYSRADQANIFKIYNKGDEDDIRLFNHSFASGYHLGYAVEQVVLFDVAVEKAFAAVKSNKVVVGAGSKASDALFTTTKVIGRLANKFDDVVIVTLRKLKLKNGTKFDQFIIGWTDEGADGLGYIAKNTDERFIRTVALRNADDQLRVISESTEYGIRIGAAKESSTTVKALTEYSEASWKQGFGAPFNPADSKHTLKRLSESTNITTQIGGTTVEKTMVIKQGEHYLDPVTNTWKGWGYNHLTAVREGGKSRIQNIMDVFHLNSEKEAWQLIDEAALNGIKDVAEPTIFNYTKNGKLLEIVTDGKGSVTTLIAKEV